MIKKKSRATGKKKAAKRSPVSAKPQPRPRGATPPDGGGFVTWEAIRRAFGNLLVMGDRSTHSASGVDKFKLIKKDIETNNTNEVLYLLAAYVFDLHLRMVYIVEALEHVGPADADRGFTETVERELAQINGDPKQPPREWEATAKDAFEVMMKAHDRIHTRRKTLVNDTLR